LGGLFCRGIFRDDGDTNMKISPAAVEFATALKKCGRGFLSVAVFSGAVNILMLAGPLYMLQIYDRVLSSRSVPTLVALTVFLLGAYAFQGILDLIRSRVVYRTAALLDRDLAGQVHRTVVQLAQKNWNSVDTTSPIRDVDQIRSFLMSAGPMAIVDLPWVPLFLAICFLIHPWIGLVALVGALLLFCITTLTERASRAPANTVSHESSIRAAMTEADRRNSESIISMGMIGSLSRRWIATNNNYVAAATRLSDVAVFYGSFSKVFRLALQSLILGLGAYLVINQELTAGSMIAASIMMGRALAPVDVAIANWRLFVAARQSVRRLSRVLSLLSSDRAYTVLPAPARDLEVERVTVMAPGTNFAVVKDVTFRLAAGEALGIIGPSGAGKTSLLRNLIGIWPPVLGTVRIDGATLNHWASEALGRHIGFLSQGVELFDGTVARNIARMDSDYDDKAVIEAGRASGAHDMILRLPLGYDTRIGEGGLVLSAGQRQRIALARALYGSPFLLILDEPNSNLDNEGESALLNAIRAAKAKNSIVVIVSHRTSTLSVCDKVLVLGGGIQRAYGPRDEVLQKAVFRTSQPAAVLGPIRQAGSKP
jgi:PrtD family type I secretion system ABC transporter